MADLGLGLARDAANEQVLKIVDDEYGGPVPTDVHSASCGVTRGAD